MPLLNFSQLGQGDPVILIHGLFGSLDNLNMVAKPLAKSFTVINIDTRNHGDSFHANSMTFAEMAQDVIDVMDHLNIQSAAILGHSMGGKIAMQCALDFPDRVSKLIVADIAPIAYEPRHNQILKGLNELPLSNLVKRSDADKALAPFVKELGVRQFLLKNLKFDNEGAQFKCNLAGITSCYSQIISWQPENKSYQGNTLFVKGMNSDYITESARTAIASQFPQAKAKAIQGAGHWLHAEKTVSFNKIVSDFLTD